MLSISKPSHGAANAVGYYLEGKESYYLHGIDQEGRWFGSGTALLDLHGNVEPRSLRHLLEGYSPDGKHALVQNAGHRFRQCYWDLTFNAPKAVSVLWAMAPPEIRSQIEQAHQQAVEKALAYVEQVAGFSRRGPGGQYQEPVSMVFAVFQEGASRAQQPHLHTHSVLINVGIREDGTTGTLQSIHFFQEKMTTGALYQTELAAGLRQRLGLTIEPERVGFHIAGVPRELCRRNSIRRQEIEAWLREHGRQGPVAAKEAALETRSKKEHRAQAELFPQWQQAGAAFGWSTDQARQLVQNGLAQAQRPNAHDAQALESRFVKRLQETVATLSKEERGHLRVIKLATHQALESGANADGLLRGLHRLYSSKDDRFMRVEWRRLGDKTPWTPTRGKLVYTRWEKLFPNAPWSVARKLKLPVTTVELPRIVFGQKFKPKWWSIKWKRDLIVGELRVQQRILFPHAPQWSPLHKLSFPAFHFSPRRSQWKPSQDWNQKIGMDKTQSH